MLRKLRIILSVLFFVGICWLFLDISEFAFTHIAFLARLQLVPSILSGSFVIVGTILICTFLFGRLYCSSICPLGVIQDGIARLKPKRRYCFVTGKPWLQLVVLLVFILSFTIGISLFFDLLEPYSAFGRIVSTLIAPVWITGSNGLAWIVEQRNSFAIGYTPLWQKGLFALLAAIITLSVIGILAWRGGRIWCNTFCPVGTFLGLISRFSILQPRLNTENCIHCGKCEHVCKAQCINAREGILDSTRCVSCFNCLTACDKNSISYRPSLQNITRGKKPSKNNFDNKGKNLAQETISQPINFSRRAFFATAVCTVTLPLTAFAANKKAPISALTRRKPPLRKVAVISPGASNLETFKTKCTGCQLCVSACPNQVLRPSDFGNNVLQPVLSFEHGYCRVNCVACSSVCPTGAIKPISVEQKSAIQIGRAIITSEICIITTDDVSCNACARNCPVKAINMVGPIGKYKRPAVSTEKCIGCGACEYVCPSRPLAAIQVEGNLIHRRI